MKLSLLQHPAAPQLDEREIADRIKARVAPHAKGTEGAQLALLILRAKVDGPSVKLATLFGLSVADVDTGLRDGLARLGEDKSFRALFHLIRSKI